MKQFKGIFRGRLAVLVIRDQSTAIIGGQNLRRLEMFARERAFARAGHADKDDQRKLRDNQLQGLWLTPIVLKIQIHRA